MLFSNSSHCRCTNTNALFVLESFAAANSSLRFVAYLGSEHKFLGGGSGSSDINVKGLLSKLPFEWRAAMNGKKRGGWL